jgi:hypothetical protein
MQRTELQKLCLPEWGGLVHFTEQKNVGFALVF